MVLTAPSMVLTDGSGSSEGAYRSQYCEWNIAPVGGKGVFLSFSRFHIEGGSVAVYLGAVPGSSSPTSSQLFAVFGDSNDVPAAFFLPNSSFGIVYSTSSLPSGNGFSLTYYGISSASSFPGDGVVRLHSSSIVAFGNAINSIAGTHKSMNNYTLIWEVSPSAVTDGLYFAFSMIDLPSAQSCVEIFDGQLSSAASSSLAYSPIKYQPSGKRLFSQCGPSASYPMPYSWVQATAAAVVYFTYEVSSGKHLKLTSPTSGADGSFEASYYSDGSNQRCGFSSNPGIFLAPSMVLTDGSSSTSHMFASQDCHWIISPPQATNNTIVLEFLDCDMSGGAVLTVFDGPMLLWRCRNCTSTPRPMLLHSGKASIFFHSPASGPLGKGFKAIYWTMVSSNGPAQETNPRASWVLETPASIHSDTIVDTSEAFNQNISNAVFHLPISSVPSELLLMPNYLYSSALQLSIVPSADSPLAMDGRPAGYQPFESLLSRNRICGLLSVSITDEGYVGGGSRPYLTDGSQIHYTASQRTTAFLRSTSGTKFLSEIVGTGISNSPSNVLNAATCAYDLDSGSSKAVHITINSLELQYPTRIQVYGGLLGYDAKLFDSQFFNASNANTFPNITAPCGKALVLIFQNTSFLPSNFSSQIHLSLSYFADLKDQGAICAAYSESSIEFFFFV